MELPPSGHDPVLVTEVLDALAIRPDGVYVDCTLGRAGHAIAIGGRLGQAGMLIGLDADARNLHNAQARLAAAGLTCRVRLFHANFAELADVLDAAELPAVDGILADLGISTNQLFDERYGLSFATDMPLDMRIDTRMPRSAADLVNTLGETVLADLLYTLADERLSRRIARRIVEARQRSPIRTTDQLAGLVRAAMPPRRGPPEKIDPATRTFLALRMAVNEEMKNLDTLLAIGPRRLRSPGGRLAIISFQSTEDRRVKQAFRQLEEAGRLRALTKRPVVPGDDEVARNPRARSSKLRAAECR